MMKTLTFFTLMLILTTALALFPATAEADEAADEFDEADLVVSIPDANLANAIRKALQLDEGTVITAAALRKLTVLEAPHADIADLGGLEYATNLTELDLVWTGVSDVSALANLTQLTSLDLTFTRVSDVAALANLTQLERLELRDTGVSDVAALAHLTQLETLDLGATAVSDIAALENLTQLTWLSLGWTDVSDIAALENLTKLTWLHLGATDVLDVAALANLTKLTELYLGSTDVSDVAALANLTQLTTLVLWGCPLSYASIHTHIPALLEKGIVVRFDNTTYPALLKIAGDYQEGAPGTTLPNPLVVEVMDKYGQPIIGKTILFENLQGGGTLSATTVKTDERSRAQVTLTLGETAGTSKVKASSEGIESWVLFNTVATETAVEAPQLAADVNGDGVVNIQDLVFVSGQFGQTDKNRADVNGDGVVNIQDLVLVAAAFGEAAAAAPALAQGDIETGSLQAADVQQWLRDAKAANAEPVGIAALEQLLAALTRIEAPPKKTVLLANYPNPFNPETWIPYQLANPAEVEVSIYAADGKLVRKLELGQVPAGVYQNRSRAAYWDGRNAQGEPVASGVYFYTLTAGEFAATRKMVIRK